MCVIHVEAWKRFPGSESGTSTIGSRGSRRYDPGACARGGGGRPERRDRRPRLRRAPRAPGALFFCVPGSRVDGHDFAAAWWRPGPSPWSSSGPLDVAVPQPVVADDARAAMAPLADGFFGEPTRALAVAGVTGTNGKTTTPSLSAVGTRPLRALRPGLGGTIERTSSATASLADRTTPGGDRPAAHPPARWSTPVTCRVARWRGRSHGSTLHRLDRRPVRRCSPSRTSRRTTSTLHGTMEDYYQAKRASSSARFPPARQHRRRARPPARDRSPAGTARRYPASGSPTPPRRGPAAS